MIVRKTAWVARDTALECVALPLTQPPLHSADLSPRGRGDYRRRRQPLLPTGEKVAAERPDEGALVERGP